MPSIIETHIGGGFIKDGSWADVLSELKEATHHEPERTEQ